MSETGAERLDSAVVDALALDHGDAVPVAGGRVSRVWRARRDGRPVALRCSPWYRTEAEVAYEVAVLTALASKVPVAAPVAPPAAVDGAVWTAFEWVDGHHPLRPVDDPAPLGALLASVHEQAGALAPPLGQRPAWCRADEFLTHPRAGGGLTLAGVLGDFAGEHGAVGDRLRRLSHEVADRLRARGAADLPRTVAHGDFGPHQILHDDGGGVRAIVDWDFCHVDSRLADLAIALAHARPTVDRAVRMIRAYRDRAGLDPGDPALLGDLRRAFHLNNLANQVCARWAQGHDVARTVSLIVTRLDREDWWGPMLAEAGRLAAGGRPRASARPPVTGVDDLEVAHELADRARVVALQYFERGVRAEVKDDGTPVSEADRAVEALLRHGLAELRPGDGVLGEELGTTEGGDELRTWVVDPIDGTGAFARGRRDWRIQIALEVAGEITVAVVDQPANGVRWWAAAGRGAFETTAGGTRPLRVSHTDEVAGAVVACHPRSLTGRLPAEVRLPPRTPLPLIELVRAEIDAYLVDCCHPWDHAPWILLVTEAGGAFTDHAGGARPDRRGGLYSNGRLHQPLLARLAPGTTA